jgi:hypothetical protein
VASNLSSAWGGLSPHLQAKFYELAEKDGSWQAKEGGVVVVAPLTESNLDLSLNWQSPFENSGPESSMPTMMAMLQSGAIQPVIDSVGGATAAAAKAIGANAAADTATRATTASNDVAKALEGRTGITRLNSTQVFAGMPPAKLQVTALFRAWSDPIKEVEEPVNQLMAWALPVKLSALGPILSRAADYAAKSKDVSLADVLAPSFAPVKIGMTYKGKTYSPLVIESIGQPINSPVNSDGRYVELLVPMTLCTLTAIDRDDWSRIAGAASNSRTA